ncbi:hypothetical protein NQ314_013303 [Rhamnusium bicolor]|uniref:EGF-like domain-containing protein n=1 Tax=Rhamnusium bicolor TaxID=1586634 RepID=A0AAV8X7G9_9CUCU|nr:hypothetical protein NQ314_013303 [Rhamnusium bicolor]
MFKLKIYTGIFCFIVLFIVVVGNRQCDTSDLNNSPCSSDTELCDGSTNSCQCLPGYERKNKTYCVQTVNTSSQSTPNYSSLVDNQGSGSIVAGILIPLFLIIFVICGIYVNRKYQILTWIRNKISHRNENYDEFMIGQDLDDDDPPLH